MIDNNKLINEAFEKINKGREAIHAQSEKEIKRANVFRNMVIKRVNDKTGILLSARGWTDWSTSDLRRLLQALEDTSVHPKDFNWTGSNPTYNKLKNPNS